MSGLQDKWGGSSGDSTEMDQLPEKSGTGVNDAVVRSVSARPVTGRLGDDPRVAQIIEAEIIPRLLLSYTNLPNPRDKSMRDLAALRAARDEMTSCPFPHAFDIAAFGALVVKGPMRLALEAIERHMAEGVSVEELMLDLLAPTARWLGEMWSADRLSFMDVTLGMSNLQQLIRLHGAGLQLRDVGPHDRGRVLLAAVPGEQHTFGISVVEEFIRLDGWDTQYEAFASEDVLMSRVANEWFDVVGLSASGEGTLQALPRVIRNLRQKIANRDARIMVGGALFASDRRNPATLGADHIAADARDAVNYLRQIVEPSRLA
jgi:methanogenic corrinoid protein MtbC1